MSTKRKTAGIAFILVTLFLDILGIGLMIPTLPTLLRVLHGGDHSQAAAALGYAMTAYSGMLFLFAPVQGALSDEWGRRPVLFLSLSGTAVCYALLSFAEPLGAWLAPLSGGLTSASCAMAVVVLAQIANGITGASITVCQSYLADISAPEDRGRNFGLIGAMFGLGLIVGPALGGMLGQNNVRWPFVLALGLTLANLLYGFFVLPESLPPERRRAFAWERANALGAFRMLNRSAPIRSLAIILALTQMGLQGLRSTWVLYTQYRFHWTTETTGYSFAAVGLCGALVQGGLIRVALKRVGEFTTLVGSLLSAALSYVIFGLARTETWMYVGMPFTAAGNACWPVAQGMASNQVEVDEQGALQGAMTSLSTLSMAVGTLGASSLFAWGTRSDNPNPLPGVSFYAGGILFLAAAILCVVWLQPSAKTEPGGLVAPSPRSATAMEEAKAEPFTSKPDEVVSPEAS